MAVFERELGDAGFVEVAEVFGDHAVVLCLCGAREWQIEAEIARELECDPAVLGGVRGGEKAATLVVLHVFAVGFEYARGRYEVNGISCGKIIKIEVSRFSAGNAGLNRF